MYYIFFAIKQKENKELSKDIFRVFQHKLSCHVPSVILSKNGISYLHYLSIFWSSEDAKLRAPKSSCSSRDVFVLGGRAVSKNHPTTQRAPMIQRGHG